MIVEYVNVMSASTSRIEKIELTSKKEGSNNISLRHR